MRGLLVRKEKAHAVRRKLLENNDEFIEEENRSHTLFLFPTGAGLDYREGKMVYLVDDSLDEVNFNGRTFAIRGNKESIEKFAPIIESRGMRVDLENPDIIFEIKKWRRKYVISVSSVFR
ncbi:MAG: hypothetical protein QXT80_01705 [Thermoplasmatales archaeon]